MVEGGLEMGKRVYRVKKGDDFIKISRKLYGNASYVKDLMRANPGFYRVGPGMVLRLPKMDPRIMRQRKIKRRLKKYGPPPPEETEDTTAQGIPTEGETGYGEESGAELSQSGESLGWDPAFEDEIINSIAETAKKIGLDADVMADELGMSEGHLPSKEASSKDWTQSKTEKGNLHSPRTSRDRGTQSQTGDIDQSATQKKSITPESVEKQIDDLKKALRKMGLDADVAMEELGVGQIDTAQTTSTDTGKETTGDSQNDQTLENLYKLAALREESEKRRAEEQEDESLAITPTLTDEIEEELNVIAQEMGVDADVLIGELGLVKRDDTILQERLKKLGIPPEIYQEASGLDKALIETDYRKLYNGIFPEEGGMYTPAGHFLDFSGFAEGYREWSEGEVDRNQLGYYVLDGDESDPIEERLPHAAQYMSPRLITKNGNLMNSIHNNLCGELAVIAALGLDLAEGLNLFAEIEISSDDRNIYRGGVEGAWTPVLGADILNDGSVGTTYLTLVNFIDHATNGKYTGTKHSSNNNQEEFGSVDYLKESIQNGNKVIALVNIDTVNDGNLRAMDDTNDPVAHWIEVQDVITTKEGETYVRVYNPYMNREEIYDEETFMAAWETTGETHNPNDENENHHLTIEISETGE